MSLAHLQPFRASRWFTDYGLAVLTVMPVLLVLTAEGMGFDICIAVGWSAKPAKRQSKLNAGSQTGPVCEIAASGAPLLWAARQLKRRCSKDEEELEALIRYVSRKV